MGAVASAQAASSYLEKLRDKVPLLYERDDIFLTMLQKNTDVEIVSPRSMRISLQVRPGGRGGQANMDGGDLGRGGGTTRIEANLSPIFFKFGVEVNKLVEYATNNASKAVENVAKKEVKNGMAQFRAYLDKLLQTDGTGVLATVGSVAGGGASLTMGAPYYSALLYVGGLYAVMTANFATNRGYVEVTAIDPGVTAAVNVVTVQTVAVGGAVLANIIPTDVLVPEGITATGTPTSMFGLKYHHNSSAVGTWLNQNRANYPEIRTPKVTANGSLVTSHVRQAKNKIRKALGINALQASKLIAYMAVEQEHAWEQLGITISEIVRSGGGNESQPDLLFGQSGTMGGAQIKTSINADPTRIDFIALNNWVRAVIQEIDFYEVGGQTIFPVYGTSGGLAAAYLFYYVLGMQLACQNPRLGAFIDTLTVPTGY
jgi:hypothetical protein